MMSIDIVALLAASICLIGGIVSWRYGEHQYGKGILDGIQMYDSGRLTYESFYEGDQKYLTINIAELEDEE
jgi:hypothetical protein